MTSPYRAYLKPSWKPLAKGDLVNSHQGDTYIFEGVFHPRKLSVVTEGGSTRDYFASVFNARITIDETVTNIVPSDYVLWKGRELKVEGVYLGEKGVRLHFFDEKALADNPNTTENLRSSEGFPNNALVELITF